MKVRNIYLTLAIAAGSLSVAAFPTSAQKIDLSKKPEPAPVKEVPFPKYVEKTLKNGIRVLIIEDHEQPTIMLRMQLTPGEVADGDKPGLASMTANLLTKGAGKRSALDIAKALDGIGASVSASAAGDATTVTASGLKKHLSSILDIYADVLTRPALTAEELEKMRAQAIEGVRYEKSEPGTLVQALARKVVYGENHPYAKKESEQSLQSISLDDVKNYHKEYFRPGNAYLAVVGDVTDKEIIPMLEKAFAHWTGGKSKSVNVPKTAPMPVGVYFIERPASVQSAFVISGPAEVFSHPEFEKISLTADMIGSGFGGRLFRTLRETYSYTYTPYGFVARSKEANRFAAGADVRNAVTDSAITVTQRELKRLGTEAPTKDELNRLQRYTVGSFLMSFESTETLASLLQLAALNNVPFQRIKEYPAKVLSITPEDIRSTAAKYMNPDKMPVIVVGSKEVLPKLEKFGTIYRFNLDIEPVRASKTETVTISADELIERHLKALGGRDAIKGLKSLVVNSDIVLSAGPQSLPGKGVTKFKMPDKSTSAIDLKVMKQQTWAAGKQAWESANGQPAEAKEGTELEDALYNAQAVPLSAMKELGYSAKINGKEGDSYVMVITSPSGNEKTLYIDANTLMVSKTEYMQNTPQGTIPMVEEYSDYRDVSGVKFPHKVVLTAGGGMTVKSTLSYEPNASVDDKEFMPAGK